MNNAVKIALSAGVFVYAFLFANCAKDVVLQNDEGPSEINQSQTRVGDDGAVSVSILRSDGAVVADAAPPTTCDLSGTWISTQRTLSLANYNNAIDDYELAQVVRAWAFWELEQTGTQVVVKRGLQCGSEVEIISRMPMFVETSMAGSQRLYEGVTLNNLMQGRTALYGGQAKSNVCQLTISKAVSVEGATFSYFKDFSHPLEEALNPAQGTTPGWEDWDDDWSPGVTYHVSGIATGDLYTVQRESTEYKGSTTKGTQKFKLNVTFQRQMLILSTNPTNVQWPNFNPSTDQADNYIWFARVDPQEDWNVAEDADDVTLCSQVRLWKSKLIPDAEE